MFFNSTGILLTATALIIAVKSREWRDSRIHFLHSFQCLARDTFAKMGAINHTRYTRISEIPAKVAVFASSFRAMCLIITAAKKMVSGLKIPLISFPLQAQGLCARFRRVTTARVRFQCV